MIKNIKSYIKGRIKNKVMIKEIKTMSIKMLKSSRSSVLLCSVRLEEIYWRLMHYNKLFPIWWETLMDCVFYKKYYLEIILLEYSWIAVWFTSTSSFKPGEKIFNGFVCLKHILYSWSYWSHKLLDCFYKSTGHLDTYGIAFRLQMYSVIVRDQVEMIILCIWFW